MAGTRDSIPFGDRLAGAIADCGTWACVGLDPVLERLPPAVRGADAPEALRRFGLGVLEAIRGVVPAVKVQSACFERYGAAGWAVLTELSRYAAGLGLVVILDGKRGDVPHTAGHYAAAARLAGAHAVTVNGYLGPQAVEPFLEQGLGAFVLVRTTNPGSELVQSARLEDGRSVAELVAEMVCRLGEAYRGDSGYSDVGAVVSPITAGGGVARQRELAALRQRMPEQWLLVPGYGAQGGTVEAIRPLVDDRGGGVVVAASRSVIEPAGTGADTAPGSGTDAAGERGQGWIAAIHAAAVRFAQDVASLRGAG